MLLGDRSLYIIVKIRDDLDNSQLDEVVDPRVNITQHENLIQLSSFQHTSVEELEQIIGKTDIKTSQIDPLPAKLIKSCLSVLLPVYVEMINYHLSSAIFPQSMKSAIVKPILKKRGLDPNILGNYRPVSNLTFESKLLEKVIARRIHDHLRLTNSYPLNQSAYRTGHSVETALVSVNDDVMMTLDSGRSVLLILLDLSSAFDTIDHEILINTLSTYYGITGSALHILASYVSDRDFMVDIQSHKSSLHALNFGVPQGSVLGPLLFTLYTKPLGLILSEIPGIRFHMFADDTQFWTDVNLDDPLDISLKVNVLQTAFAEVHDWMKRYKLKLNTTKTEFLVLTPKSRRREIPNIELNLGGTIVKPSDQARNLGVHIDKNMSSDYHISSVIKSCYILVYVISILSGPI